MMKKVWILLIIVILSLTACNKNIKYDEWKDSIASYGDGTYQIIHQSIDNKTNEILTNCKHNQCVMTEIEKYTEENEYVYFTGKYYNKRVFCKLNISNNMLSYFAEDNGEELIMVYMNNMHEDKQIEIYKSLDDFSEEDRSIFDSMG